MQQELGNFHIIRPDFRKTFNINLLIQNYVADSSKVYSFENIITILNDNFNEDNYNYYVKHNCGDPIYKKFKAGNISLSDYNEILYIKFYESEDLITFKLLI